MTVLLHLGLSVMTRKFAKVHVMCLYRHHVVHITPFLCGMRSFGTDPNDSDKGSDAPVSTFPPFSRRTSLSGRHRPLSPLERVSQLLPEDSLSQEVWELRDTQNNEAEHDTQSLGKEREEATEEPQSFAPHHVCVPGERQICFGETLLAEFSRKRRLEFRKMFQLKEGMKLHSNWGLIAHEDMEGRPAGSIIRTSMGIPILIRRPSLDEFTLFMKRGPAITYPKVRNDRHHKTAVSHLHISESVIYALFACIVSDVTIIK